MKKILLLSNFLILCFAVLAMMFPYFSFSQNVGVGTSTPSGKFQVNHRSSNLNPSIVIFDSSTSSAGRIKFYNTGGSRYWQINALVNNTIPSGQYMDIVTDSLWILTLRGNGNVGINNLAPAYKLDVGGDGYFDGTVRVNNRLGLGVTNPTEKLDINGNINLTGAIKVDGNAGTNGQVLASTGNSGLQWKNAAYANNSRFAANIPENTGTGALSYTAVYNLNPADVAISGTTITINKTGLWHFEGYIHHRMSWTGPPAAQTIYASFTADGVTYLMIDDGLLDRDPMIATSYDYTKTLNFSHDVYISAPATVNVFRSLSITAGGVLPVSRNTVGLISGFLISE